MPFPRLTWAGLLIATFGWGLLLSYPLFVPHGGSLLNGPDLRDPARFILIFGENAVVTGFALALLGALEKALVLLSRLNGGVGATRPNTRGTIQQQAPQQPQPYSQPQMPHTPHLPMTPHTPQAQVQPQLVLQRSANSANSANEVITRGALNGRDYVLFRDGSVLLETLLGPRRFASITEAQEFIGAN